jgi:hypothetical protein
MKEMMKRCLSLGFSLPIIVLTGMRSRKQLVPASSLPAPSPQATPQPSPTPVPSPPEFRPLVSFCGTVIRDGSRFALQDATGALFALQSTGRAWPFEGEEVQVAGYLDPTGTVLQIQAIHAIEDLRAQAV